MIHPLTYTHIHTDFMPLISYLLDFSSVTRNSGPKKWMRCDTGKKNTQTDRATHACRAVLGFYLSPSTCSLPQALSHQPKMRNSGTERQGKDKKCKLEHCMYVPCSVTTLQPINNLLSIQYNVIT